MDIIKPLDKIWEEVYGGELIYPLFVDGIKPLPGDNQYPEIYEVKDIAELVKNENSPQMERVLLGVLSTPELQEVKRKNIEFLKKKFPLMAEGRNHGLYIHKKHFEGKLTTLGFTEAFIHLVKQAIRTSYHEANKEDLKLGKGYHRIPLHLRVVLTIELLMEYTFRADFYMVFKNFLLTESVGKNLCGDYTVKRCQIASISKFESYEYGKFEQVYISLNKLKDEDGDRLLFFQVEVRNTLDPSGRDFLKVFLKDFGKPLVEHIKNTSKKKRFH